VDQSSTTDDDQGDALELINEELAGRLSRQNQTSVRIETKSTVLLGFSATAAQFLATQEVGSSLLAMFAFITYAIAFSAGIWTFRVSTSGDIEASRLRDYTEESREHILRRLIAARVHLYKKVSTQNEWKARTWWLGIGAFSVGLVLSVVALLVHTR
jgi:hypothetical protein